MGQRNLAPTQPFNWVGDVEPDTAIDVDDLAAPAETRGVAYLRMSTDMQQYSTANQMQFIAEYARTRNINVVRIYSDEGRSGLTLKRRDALQALLKIVQSGKADFTEVLVYDVTRWGRFLDPDESAAYELSCKQAGVQVHYCAESFINDGTPLSGMMKHFKRAMAGEYSRELSTKVRRGQIRLAEMGYWLAGAPGYGLRKVSVSSEGEIRRVLGPGERKSAYTDHLKLIPGPAEEVQTVRGIFVAYVDAHQTITEITRGLNNQNIPWKDGTPWTCQRVKSVLKSDKYTGTMVYGRSRCNMGERIDQIDPEEWVCCENAFEPLIDKSRFLAARARLRAMLIPMTDEALLDTLRVLLKRYHYLGARLLDHAPESQFTTAVYVRRFGSLLTAYDLIGYIPRRLTEQHCERARLHRFIPKCFQQTLAAFESAGVPAEALEERNLFSVNGELTVGFQCCRPTMPKFHTLAWQVKYDEINAPDLHLVVRLDRRVTHVLDYYLFPKAIASHNNILLFRQNRGAIDMFRHEDLLPLIAMGRRTSIGEI